MNKIIKILKFWDKNSDENKPISKKNKDVIKYLPLSIREKIEYILWEDSDNIYQNSNDGKEIQLDYNILISVYKCRMTGHLTRYITISIEDISIYDDYKAVPWDDERFLTIIEDALIRRVNIIEEKELMKYKIEEDRLIEEKQKLDLIYLNAINLLNYG